MPNLGTFSLRSARERARHVCWTHVAYGVWPRRAKMAAARSGHPWCMAYVLRNESKSWKPMFVNLGLTPRTNFPRKPSTVQLPDASQFPEGCFMDLLLVPTAPVLECSSVLPWIINRHEWELAPHLLFATVMHTNPSP